MEVIKKRILQALTTGITATTGGNKYIIIPDLAAVYNIKIGLCSVVKDIGFFDTYVLPVPPYNPYYYSYGGISIPIGLENLM
jgi:hypothetical protein